MKRTIGCLCLSSAVLCGCAAQPSQVLAPQAPEAEARLAVHREYASAAPEEPLFLAIAPEEVVATLPGLAITQKQFLAPLIEGHGLPVLLNVVQLELAKQNAQRKGLGLTPEEVDQERDRTLAQAFGEPDNKTENEIQAALAKGDKATAERLRQELKRDRERALEQLLTQQRVSRPEFELVLKTNAFLRKIARQGMPEISDDVLRKAFETEYGSTVRVRHIQATSRQDLVSVQERLKAGEAFEKVARDLSRNPRTGPLGGELPKFSMATSNIPDIFKQVAFGLSVKQVSDVVECDGAYHLIKLEDKFAPRAVKFEGVKEGLREKVREQVVARLVEDLREQLAHQTRAAMKIEDPVLREQFDRKMRDRDRQITDMKELEAQQERERQARQARQQQQQPGAPVDPQSVLPVPGPVPASSPAPGAAPAPAPAAAPTPTPVPAAPQAQPPSK